jgi:hypothetical protein
MTHPDVFRLRPALWRRWWLAVRTAWTPAAPLAPLTPHYRYSPGMERPDARYAAVPGAVARQRELDRLKSG